MDWLAPAFFGVICGLIGLVRQLDVKRIETLEREIAQLRPRVHRHAKFLMNHHGRLQGLDGRDDDFDPNGSQD